MATLANLLSPMTAAVDRPVLDRTGLKGGYNFNLNLHNPPPKGTNPSDLKSSATDSENIFSAVQEQLGLKLEPRKAPVEILIIDHAEKLPTEN
jgi:uncharacterized protein (TIGR03435 family)